VRRQPLHHEINGELVSVPSRSNVQLLLVSGIGKRYDLTIRRKIIISLEANR
jgi:hypothetical protein